MGSSALPPPGWNNVYTAGDMRTGFYTGIGSRETPEPILAVMALCATQMARQGYVLRSGGAPGADMAFEMAARKVMAPMEIYLPWPGFNGNPSKLFAIDERAMAIAERHHRGWPRLSPPVRKLMARNVYQIMGWKFSKPSELVICWTPDGYEGRGRRTSKTGGTGLAIDVADSMGVPVKNLQREQSYDEVMDWLARKGAL